MNRIVVTWVMCVLAAVAIASWAGVGIAPLALTAGNSDTHGVAQGGTPLIVADFSLQTAGGKTVRATDLRGKYLLVYFGFTHCPDVCPTTLLLMKNLLSHLGERAAHIQPVFITVDPERDTPAITAAYAKNFGNGFLGLSGSAAQIKHAADSFKVYYSKVTDTHSALGYAVDHSSFIYLMGPDGRYLSHFPSTDSEDEIMEGLQHDIP